jgi:hypothetical protein
MESGNWKTKLLNITNLHLDSKNPRIGRETTSRAPREIIQYLFEHDKAIDVAESIALRGFFPNEPLLAIKENGRTVVIEGNRRLAALKALNEPGLLDGSIGRQVERLAKGIENKERIGKVPVTLAPSRRSTDRQIVGRHIGSPVLAWEAENRASFILDKLSEGYTNEQLGYELGFSLADIQKARQTRAIADMARSLDLPEEVKAKLENPRAKLFTTLERVFDSSVGRENLLVEPDPDHGLRGLTTKVEFLRGFVKLVTDVALGKQSSRTLNTNDDIRTYFDSLKPEERPSKKTGSFVPADIIEGKSVASASGDSKSPKVSSKSKPESKTVLPKDLKIKHGSPRLIDIRRELCRLKRDDYPNAGAVLLRVFLELMVLDYFQRSGELTQITTRLREKGKLRFGSPTMKDLVPDIIRLAKEKLPETQSLKVEKALRYDSSAPFTLSDLHSFVHQSSELPTARDIYQFWLRTEPLFRLMLEQDIESKQ